MSNSSAKAKSASAPTREFRVYYRPNLGTGAKSSGVGIASSNGSSFGPPANQDRRAKAPESLRYRCTFRNLSELPAWLEKRGDKGMVYLIERWQAGERKTEHRREYICCGMYTEHKRTFVQKWAWDAHRNWHQCTFVHRTENAGDEYHHDPRCPTRQTENRTRGNAQS